MSSSPAVSSDESPLIIADPRQQVILPPGPPVLIVSIDTEAEYDWHGPFLRTNTKVDNLRHQAAAQAIFDRFGVRPIYLIDYAVATTPAGAEPLRGFAASERCEIGAHLHPWITPPFDEELGARASYSHNLPAALQREKLARLTDAIVANFGARPITYRAGRYGIGDEMGEILAALGYQIDMSVLPGTNHRPEHGQDFRRSSDRPYWFGPANRLLEIPLTFGFTGLLAHAALPRGIAVGLYNKFARSRFRICGALALLRLLDHMPLSPEGVEFAALRRLTYAQLARGNRVFVLSYHSSSLLPGSTDYVRTPEELAVFLRTIEDYLEFFIGELGGISMTPSAFRALLPRQPGAAAAMPIYAAAK